ncbi:hypothetical protein [Ruegeria hyattellae]|uniref:hypothetical protein n=1 Tax=Ruegeria hyattellae TaxID=3233337 RepID=UPI00355AE27E
MTSNNPWDGGHAEYGARSTHVASQPLPRQTQPFWQLLFGGTLGILICLAIHFLVVRGPSSALGPKGPQYVASDIKLQSYDPSWTQFLGESALDMKMVILPPRGGERETYNIDGSMLRALCGAVLRRLPAPPDGVSRDDIYRVGFRFIGAENGELTDKHPVPVESGTCRTTDGQMIFHWAYPGQLAGWAPVNYEQPEEREITVNFGRRGETKTPYDLVDLELACEALFTDTSDQLRELLKQADKVNIRIVKGLAGAIGWVGLYNLQQFQIVNDTCIPMGEVLEG